MPPAGDRPAPGGRGRDPVRGHIVASVEGSYFHRAEELVAELVASGLTDVQVFGIEGPAWSLVKAAEQQPGEGPTDELIASAMEAARMAEPYPELLAASSHLLAVGRAPAGINAGEY